MQGLMMDRPLLISALIDFAATFHGDTEIVSRSVEGPIHRYTYADALRRSAQLAHALRAQGVKPGDRIATIAWNTWRHFELYYAVSGIGAVCHMINPRLSADHKTYIVNHADDRLVFFDACFGADVASWAETCPNVDAWVAMTDVANMPEAMPAGSLCYEVLLDGEPDAIAWPEFDENTASSMCYTSGTTGNPKGVLYSHRSIVLHSYGCCLRDTMKLGAHETVLPVVPMFHVNAWGIPYSTALVGAKLVMPGPALDGASLFDLMEAETVTQTAGVPTVWMGLLAEMKARGRAPKGLSRVLIGGAAPSQAMIDSFELDFGIKVSHAWGMTEMTPLGVVNDLKPKFESLPRERQMPIKMKQGRAIFGADMRIVGPNDDILPNDGETAGRLQVRGPWIVQRYYGDDADATTADGWFDTGDIATIDPDGYMHITDRAKDVIKSGGEWISSVDLENAAMGHPAIQMAAVIGVSHPKWQERPLLICVVNDTSSPPTLDELHAYLADKVPKWWLPDALEVVESIPIGATGKILKSELRARFSGYSLPADP